MKVSKYILLAFIFYGSTMQSQSLKKYRWNNRILVLVSQKADSAAFIKQKETLLAKDVELADRDVIILVLKGESVEFADGNKSPIDNAELRNELKIDSAFEGVILIGKDGGEKIREKFHVEPQKIFDLIDSMPMRRAEMRN